MIDTETIVQLIATHADLTNYIGDQLVAVLPYFALVFVGYAVEKNYTSRPALFSNGVAVASYTSLLPNPPWFALLYSFIGLIVGVIAILSYDSNASLSGNFYNVGKLWNSLIVGLYLIAFTFL